MMLRDLPFTLDALRRAYDDGAAPEAVVDEAFRRLAAAGDPGIFLHTAREAALAAARGLGPREGRPLWGIPFAVKDNIDVAGMPTTAACPDFAYDAAQDAFVVARLRAAGAICLGKTNLDQFATGLVGVRTPYPVPRNALDPAVVPGGSSSGSAVAVARGIVAFALGTDTAGSGRVPAALNGIVGLKPSLGALSARGMVPACRSLDTISVFALTTADAWAVFALAAAGDAEDAYSREFPPPLLSPAPPALHIAVPDAASLVFDGDEAQAADFRATLARLRSLGAEIVEIDFRPFLAVAKLLYEGPWVAERAAALGALLERRPEALHPVTRRIVGAGLGLSAVEAFRGQYRLAELKKSCAAAWAGADMLCVPSMPRFVSMAEISADPIGPNALLGTYTNFVNLLDLCGLALPTGPRADGRPGSVTLLGRAGADALLAALGLRIEAGAMGATPWPRPAPPALGDRPATGEIEIVVCGAHMSGLALNRELARHGARLLRATRTAPCYRLYALAGGPPERPGLVRQADGIGHAIAVEAWALPHSAVGAFLAGIPAPLGLGTVLLEDGGAALGFLCESAGLAGAKDISALGDWRAYLAAREPARLPVA